MKAAMIFVLASCTSSAPSLDPAKLDKLDFGVPSGWTSRDLSLQHLVVEWRPVGDNERKESLVISRVDNPAYTAEKSRPHLKRELVAANHELPGAAFGVPRAFVTRSGLFGLRVDGSFTPPAQTATYHRTHAILVEGTALVHVLYTARDPDRDSLEAVLDGFRPGA